MIQFTIPGEPVAQGRPRAGKIINGPRKGQTVLRDPEKSKGYKYFVRLIASAHRPEKLLEGPIELTVSIYRTIPESWSGKKKAGAAAGEILPTTKPDCSNILKGIEDGLNTVIWKDDSQIVDLIVKKRYSDTPRVDITIKEIGNE